MNKSKKSGSPSFKAVGRVARALTFPFISEGLDLTLRELNAIATIAHVNIEAGAKSSQDANGTPHVVDTYDAFVIEPGAGQAFETVEVFEDVVQALKEKGLVQTEESFGRRLHLLNQDEKSGPGTIVTLTEEGKSLVDAMTSNLAKSLVVLDNESVRKDLSKY